jgi:hypothetical protein
MCKLLTFCQFFLRSETRKLMPTAGQNGGSGRMEQRHTQHDVAEHLIVGHLDMADGDAQAEDLLQLELDRRADLVQLVREVLCMRYGRGELAGLRRD